MCYSFFIVFGFLLCLVGVLALSGRVLLEKEARSPLRTSDALLRSVTEPKYARTGALEFEGVLDVALSCDDANRPMKLFVAATRVPLT